MTLHAGAQVGEEAASPEDRAIGRHNLNILNHYTQERSCSSEAKI